MVSTVFNVFEEVFNDVGRYNKACVFETRFSLEGDSHDFIILNCGTTAIAWVDGSIGLHGEEVAIIDVGVALHFNS